MRIFTLNTVAVALVLLSLVGSTGAVLGDEVWEEEGVVLRPHNGPNGKFASFDGNGNLSVDLGDDLNADAVTTFDGVFDVSNAGSRYLQVWITHNATAFVTFRTGGAGSIQGEDNGTVLSPGETIAVGLTVDTHGAPPNTQLMDRMNVHARRVPPPPRSSGSGGSGGSGGGDSSPTPTPTGTIVDSGEVRIEFDREVRSDVAVRTDRLDGLPPDPSAGEPTAIARRMDTSSATSEGSSAGEGRLEALGADSVATPGETLVVSGTASRFPSADSIDPRRRTAAVYDVRPPTELEDEPARIWITVDRSRFGDVDPSEARVARRTSAGWHLLETRITGLNATHVEVRSRTPGFSTFAVFLEPDVGFLWTFEGKGTIGGETATVSYEEPGVYDARLAVTDAVGRSDETTHRILVNDRPRVRIEAPTQVPPGEPIALRANVTNRYGNTSVTWTFPDGTTASGERVTHRFQPGQHAVRATVTDEFGATAEDEVTVSAGGSVVEVVEFALGLEGRLALVALLALVVVGSFRWLQERTGIGVARRSR